MSSILVLHCAETIKGGIATYLRDLLPLQLAEFGAGAVAVVVPASQLPELPLPEGILLLPYADVPSRVRSALVLAREVVKHCKSLRPDVVHVHSTFAGAVVRPALAVLYSGARVVYCPHGWAWDRPMAPMARRVTRLVEAALAFLCEKVVCISEYERCAAIGAGVAASRLTVVLNGVLSRAPVTIGRPPAWPGTGLRLLFIGRFDRQKGVDLFCEALRQLGDAACGVMAGGSVLADQGGLDIPANARSEGWVSPGRMQTLFESADVLIVPSRWEGFGLIAAEAMRAGLPVIASRVGGLPEVVLDGVTGVLVEPDDVDAIVTAVRHAEDDLLEQMGKAGQSRFAQLFTMERVHRELCDLYGLASASGVLVREELDEGRV